MKIVYLFDLDSTITREEILPLISRKKDEEKRMREITERTMLGEISFIDSFTDRVKLLCDLPIDEIALLVKQVKLNEKIANFIKKRSDRCFVVTSNLDVWIEKLMEKIGMEQHCYCSAAQIHNGKIVGIKNIIRKEDVIKDFDCKVVAVGDGSNDEELIKKADIGIAFGGVRAIAPALLKVCDYAVYSEDSLCDLLEKIDQAEFQNEHQQ